MPYANNDGVEIYYEVHGAPTAPVLVLVAGMGEQVGGVEFPLEQVEHFLNAGFRVVRVDSRDAGLSESFDIAGRPDMDAVLGALMSGEVPTVPYSHFDMADDLIAVADHLGAGAVHVVGASAGGFVVRWAAIRHPDRVRSVTVVMSGSGAGFDEDGPQMDLSTFDELLAEGDHRTTEAQIDHLVELWRHLWGSSLPFDEAWITQTVSTAVHRSYRPDGFLRQLTAAMAAGGCGKRSDPSPNPPSSCTAPKTATSARITPPASPGRSRTRSCGSSRAWATPCRPRSGTTWRREFRPSLACQAPALSHPGSRAAQIRW